MQDQTSQVQSRVQPIAVWVAHNRVVKVCPDIVEIVVGDSVEWIFRAQAEDSIEIQFEVRNGAGGESRRGPFPAKEAVANPAEGIFRQTGKGEVVTLPAREPAQDENGGWPYTVRLKVASGEVVEVDPIIIVRASQGPDF